MRTILQTAAVIHGTIQAMSTMRAGGTAALMAGTVTRIALFIDNVFTYPDEKNVEDVNKI